MFNLLGGVNIYRLPPEARGLPLAKVRRLTSGRGQIDIEELMERHVDRAQRHVERHIQHAQRRVERHQRRWGDLATGLTGS